MTRFTIRLTRKMGNACGYPSFIIYYFDPIRFWYGFIPDISMFFWDVHTHIYDKLLFYIRVLSYFLLKEWAHFVSTAIGRSKEFWVCMWICFVISRYIVDWSSFTEPCKSCTFFLCVFTSISVFDTYIWTRINIIDNIFTVLWYPSNDIYSQDYNKNICEKNIIPGPILTLYILQWFLSRTDVNWRCHQMKKIKN